MKLHLLLENLQKKLSLLNRGVSTKSQLPVLLNFLLVAENGVLKIRSTDLEIGIEIDIPVNIEEEGAVTVVARKFSDLLSSLPPGKVTLQTIRSTLEVVNTKTKSTFQTIPKEEFPKLYDEKGEEIIETESDEFFEKIAPVLFAASIDTIRPALSAVLLKKEADALFLVATDGYRLSLKTYKDEGKAKEGVWEKPLLVPARMFKELSLVKEGGVLKVYLSKQENQIVFTINGTTIIGRLIEAEYPNYQKIIPSSFTTRVTIDREELEKAVKIASVFAREAANVVKFDIKKERIFVSANAPSVGENIVEVESILEGSENQIAFNAKYVLDVLSALTTQTIIIEMTGPLSPGVFKIKEDESYLHIIMPIRVQQ